MRKRTGNGTTRRQYLYILANLPFVWVVKIGITGDTKRRWNDIDRSAAGKDFAVWCVKIRFAYQVEQFIHTLCAPLSVRFSGSGHTERFLFPAAIIALILSIVVWALEWAVYIGVTVGVLYLLTKNGGQ